MDQSGANPQGARSLGHCGAQQPDPFASAFPPDKNWDDEQTIPLKKLKHASLPTHKPPTAIDWCDEQTMPLTQVEKTRLHTSTVSSESLQAGHAEPLSVASASDPHSLAGIDPFVWWSSSQGQTSHPVSRSGTALPIRLARSSQPQRRKVLACIVTGTAAVGVLTVCGISFASFLHSSKRAPLPAFPLSHPGPW